MICSNCGAKIKDNSKFCSECGRAVSVHEIHGADHRSTSTEDDSEKRQKRIILGILLTIIAATVLAMIFVPQSNHQNNAVITDYDTDEIVPDSFLYADLPSMLEELGKPQDYAFADLTYEHSPDTEAHLDYARITFDISHSYGNTTHYIDALYQYYSDSDTWRRMRCDWQDDGGEYDYDALVGAYDTGDTRRDPVKEDYIWTVTIIEISTSSITLQYDIVRPNSDEDFNWSDTETFQWNGHEAIYIPFEYSNYVNGNEIYSEANLIVHLDINSGVRSEIKTNITVRPME